MEFLFLNNVHMNYEKGVGDFLAEGRSGGFFEGYVAVL
jgi:hypothetical protein